MTPRDTFPPAAPEGLSVVAGAGTIESELGRQHGEPDLAGYLVLRGEAPGETLQPLTPAPIAGTSFEDKTVKPGVRYVYAIVAVDKAAPPNRARHRRASKKQHDDTILPHRVPRHGRGTSSRRIRAGGCSKATSSASTRRATRFPSTGHRLLAPVEPSKIVAVGLNYKDHAAEQNKPLPAEPMIFIKPSTAVIGPDDPIVLPTGSGASITRRRSGVVIGTRASQRAGGRGAPVYLRNDVRQRRHGARAAEEGHPVHARERVRYLRARRARASRSGLDYDAPDGLAVEGWVNGTRRQSSSTRELIFPIPRLVAFISSVMTLLPGDIISTGTPAGIGPLAAGDRVTVTVEGVGEITDPS